MLPNVSKKIFMHAKNMREVLYRQWWSENKLAEWQNEKIRSLIKHAYERVPFHGRRMKKQGLQPEDIQTVDDLSKLPLCSKTEMRNGFPQDVVAEGFESENCIALRTSGSTGRFLDVLHSRQSFDYAQALGFRQYHGLGFRPWHTRAYFRWEPFEYSYPFEKFGLLRKKHIPALIDPEAQFMFLMQAKPDMITGYPSTFFRFIRGVDREKIRRIRPKFLITNSEQLTPEVAQLMRDAFECDVFDEYSMFEVLQTAFECKHHSYHIVSDNVVLECVDPQGRPVKAGETGELVVTGFMNQTMPFIRYRTNDFGILSDKRCVCGRTFPVLQKIVGRVDDFIMLPSGKLIGPPLIIGIFYPIEDIRAFQVIQEKIGQLTIQIACVSVKNDRIQKKIISAFQKTFPDEPFDLSIVFVDEIKTGSTGKTKSVISNPELLKTAYDGVPVTGNIQRSFEPGYSCGG